MRLGPRLRKWPRSRLAIETAGHVEQAARGKQSRGAEMPVAPMEKLRVEERHRVSRAAQTSARDGDEPVSVQLRLGDARDLSWLPDDSVHLAVTSPPYWTLKRYNERSGQLGHVADYEEFLDELDQVWRHAYRVLVPGGRLVCVVGDVCLSRREHGRHVVMPLHADITVRCRRIGFDNLNPIIWHKIANAQFEVENGSKFLGKPYEPNAIIKNDMEFITDAAQARGLPQANGTATAAQHDRQGTV